MTTAVMEEQIRVQFTQDHPVVSARDLHRALEIKTVFRQWFPRMCEYGFSEGTDYEKVYQKCDGSRTGQMEVDYLISTDISGRAGRSRQLVLRPSGGICHAGGL